MRNDKPQGGNMIKFTIPVAPVSKKNSQRIVNNPKTGRPFIMPSAKYKQYEKDCAAFLPRMDEPISRPVNVACVFYMPTRRRCDLVNLQEAVLDIMVHYGILEDDNSNIVVSMDGSRVGYDKENPRTEVVITEIKE